jgi:hypothetical protein
MEHNKHIMVLMYSHLDGRSAGESIADSCSSSPHATSVPGCTLWYDLIIKIGTELTGTWIDLPWCALVRSRTGSSG